MDGLTAPVLDQCAEAALDRRVSVAPMMERTDRHARYFLRLISPHALLYTEMITTGAIIHGDRERFLRFDPAEHPVAIQLGGCDPDDLARCAEIATEWGYDEINLNVGCPSDRVQNARFGACLMAEPDLVARGVSAMRSATDRPVTVKSRIGIDDMDDYDHLKRFVDTVAATGCDTFIVHARKAWLFGLSPKENREVPPLRHESVYRLKQEFPTLTVVTNGGIATVEETNRHLARLDGVMIGRAAYETPWLLAAMEADIFGSPPSRSRHGVIEAFLPYVEREMARGVPLKSMTRHLLGLFQGRPGARAWRRHLSETAHLPDAGPETIQAAARLVAPDEA